LAKNSRFSAGLADAAGIAEWRASDGARPAGTAPFFGRLAGEGVLFTV
jgi:hypothetical protein